MELLLRVILDELGGKLEKIRKSIGHHFRWFYVQDLCSQFLENFTRKISIDRSSMQCIMCV